MLVASGLLDPDFASGLGVGTLPISINSFADDLTPVAEAVQSDGKIVVAASGTSPGSASTRFLVARFDSNGAIDETFGNGGKVVVTVKYSTAATAVAIQPNGMIVVAGTTVAPSAADAFEGQPEDVVARLDQNGLLDNTFGLGGAVSFPVGGQVTTYGGVQRYLGRVNSVLIQADGGIVIAGTAENAKSTGVDFAAARITASGVLDGTFSMAGVALVPVAVTNFQGVAVESNSAVGAGLQPDGQLVIAGSASAYPGSSGPSFAVAVRLNLNGTLDTTFGSTDIPGVAHPYSMPNLGAGSIPKSINAMILQPDGSIVLAGDGPSAIRLTPLGALDTTFGNAGEATLTLPKGVHASAEAVAIAPGGDVVLGLASKPGFLVARLTPTGAPDPTFGAGSTPGIGAALGAPVGGSIAIGTDGNYLLANNASSFNGPLSFNSIALAQVLSAPKSTTPALDQPPADLDGSGLSDLAVYLTTTGAFAYRPTDGAPDVVVPFGTPGAGKTLPAVGDYDGVGHAEIAAYLPASGSYAIRDPATNTDRVVPFGTPGAGQSIPAPGDYFGTGVDDIAVYLTAPGAFAIRPPSGGPDRIIAFGQAGVGNTIPAPADYFGTGVDDIAAYLPALGAFAIRNPTTNRDEIIPFGIPGAGNSIPVPGDYDGSGKAELAVYLPKLGVFAYRPAKGGPDKLIAFGTANDGSLPTPGDYTGAGVFEISVYDPNGGTFAYRPAGGGADVIVGFGPSGTGKSIPIATPPGAGSSFTGVSAASIQVALGPVAQAVPEAD